MRKASESIGRHRQAILSRMAEAARRAGRDPQEIELMGVTKTRSQEEILGAREAGITLFGENRVQEAESRWEALSQVDEVHLIGSLQSNKTARAVTLFNWIDSVDRIKIIQHLQKEAARQDKRLSLLLEVNSSGEKSKHGFSGWDDLAHALQRVVDADNLQWCGLMTMGPLNGKEREVRHAFSWTRELLEKAEKEFPLEGKGVLSMGMSADFSWAIAEGSTMVRVGTALFGGRS